MSELVTPAQGREGPTATLGGYAAAGSGQGTTRS